MSDRYFICSGSTASGNFHWVIQPGNILSFARCNQSHWQGQEQETRQNKLGWNTVCAFAQTFRSSTSNGEFPWRYWATQVAAKNVNLLCFPFRSVVTRIKIHKGSVTTQKFIYIYNKIVYLSGQRVSTRLWVIFKPTRK